MIKKSLSALALGVALSLTSHAIPEGMTYAGLLTDQNGNPVAPTTAENRDLEFRLYDAASGGTLLWGESQNVTVFNGNFSVVLGNGVALGATPSGKSGLANALAEADGATYFLGITPVGGAEFAPRQGLLPTAFAYRSRVAESVNGDFLNAIGSNLGVGVANPQATVHTNGTIFIDNNVFSGPSNGTVGGGGERLVLSSGNANNPPYALGITGGTLWSSVPQNARHAWYINRQQRMTLNNTGLGLGTASPESLLHLFSASSPMLKIQSNGTNEESGRLALRQSNEAGFDIYYDGVNGRDKLMFQSRASTGSNGIAMSINQSNLDIGINTDNPRADLHVNGQAFLGGTRGGTGGLPQGSGEGVVMEIGRAHV